MAKKEFIGMTDQPFSSAVRSGDFIFTSGRSGYVDARGNPVKCIQAQTRQCLENLKKQLELAGASLSDVVKVQAFLLT